MSRIDNYISADLKIAQRLLNKNKLDKFIEIGFTA